jgi:endonuclease-3
MKADRAAALLRRLKELYPDAGCTLHWTTPLELLVATILSAQCTDKRVNIVTLSLFQTYKTPHDYVAMTKQQLERDIHSCGTFRMKAKAIQETCRILLRDFDGQIPRTMKDMLTLRGVGRKTASVVLSTAFGVHEGIAVDTHVMRVSRRLGLTKAKTQAGIERDLMRLFPPEEWGAVSHLLIFHGRTVCKARGHTCHCAKDLFQLQNEVV